MTLPVRNLTIPEVAEALRCSKRHVQRLVALRKLKVVHAGVRKVLVTESELQRFVERNER